MALNGKRVAVIMPGYNVAQTLEITVRDLPDIVDATILVDDHSTDETGQLGKQLGLTICTHARNQGYGAAQKTGYAKALALGADIAVMVHPDYQYDPKLVTAMASMLAYGVYDAALGSRMIGGTALGGGMPLYKFVANRFLTSIENIFVPAHLSEYHTGYRAFSRQVLEKLPLLENSDDFVFDNQMLAQLAFHGFRIGQLSCPTKYFAEASSMSFRKGIRYGSGVLTTTAQYALTKWGIRRYPIFDPQGRKLMPSE
jgi:glycosyltransferase involved in cell wall biosynthesis